MLTRRFLLGAGVAVSFVLPDSPVLSAQRSALHRRDRHRRPVVMLDPGHGGKDPGAIGVSGTYEKVIALETAKDLHRLLRRAGRYHCELTRNRDIFIPLEQRVRIAEHHGASLFVSMHADAIHDHSVRGASVYTMAARASDAQTAALARSENAADRYGGLPYHDAPPEVARILTSLVLRETRVGSARMAHSVVTHLGDEVPLLTNPSRHAHFAVLQATNIPSVLVEMGFMSNPADERALRKRSHRMKVALAMKQAIDAWFAYA